MALRPVLLAAALAAMATPVSSAFGDVLDDTGKKLVSFEAEARELGSGIKKPSKQPKKADVMARRLIDAQVAFGVGNFDNAALLLYDYVAQDQKGRDFDTALYYLGESLFQKTDRVGARANFARLVKEVGPSSKYYQQSLERLIELSLIMGESEGVEEWLADLDRVPGDKRRPSVPYVRGKYSFSAGNYDEAVTWFTQVGATTEYGFQAQYYLGVTYVAKKDLGKATQAFGALLEREPKTDDDRRVQELAQLALGRLYYERDQPTKAIDTYLLIDRKSDLFPDALYEVAWVYVKAKQFDKALRALELLALADPTSQKLPTVKILEGNLRVRKAQSIHEKLVQGLDTGAASGAEEYLKATDIFDATHATYQPPHDELGKIIEANEDPQVFLAQITGRSSTTFQTNSTMPEIAAAWIRDEPNVERVMTIETDLGTIQEEIVEAERTIERLDAALSAPNRVNVFPSLATKRSRSQEILEEVLKIRVRLAEEELNRARRSASGAQIASTDGAVSARKALEKRLADLPDADVAYGKRVERARAEYDELERSTAEVQLAIDTTQATVVAIDKFLKESAEPKDPAQKTAWENQKLEAVKVITELNLEIDAMHGELENVRREITLGRDQAGTGDDVTLEARKLRAELRGALATEHRVVGALVNDTRINDLMRRADAVINGLDVTNATIDEIVEVALTEVRESVLHEKAELASYRREFLLYEAESRALGGTVLGNAFRDVKSKFYEVLVRSDVGIVDVNWSQKEESDDDLQRINLDKSREIKQLKDEFSDLIDEAKEEQRLEEERAKKAQQPPAPIVPPGTPPASTTPPATSGGLK
ncbi:MAG TPA: tetratricopeptide repeat protein [Kofleriaceae bacterium]|nr:tetratricopeptide repeat protein [Kofleriaceae bacterium]